MNRIFELNKVYLLIVACLSSVIPAVLLAKIESKYGTTLTAMLASMAVGLIAIGVGFLAEQAVGLLPSLRRAIAGDDWVEGIWCDTSHDPSTGARQHISLMELSYADGELVVSSTHFDVNQSLFATNRSAIAHYSRGRLICQYESLVGSATRAQSDDGILNLMFSNPPDAYTGFFIDFSKDRKFGISGRRIASPGDPDFKILRTDAGRREYVAKLLSAPITPVSQSAASGSPTTQAPAQS